MVLTVSLGASACSSGAEPKRSTGERPSSSSSPSTTTAQPTKSKAPRVSTLSGLKGRKDRPLIAVKIDNTAPAHPQAGVSKADVVYIEQVEGGVTRLAAVYSSRYPTYVGPVRSARITDIELLKQYGKVGLIYSGAQRRLRDNLRRADLGLVSFDDNSTGYRRVLTRPLPYNVIGRFDRLVRRAGKADLPAKVGYKFGPPPAGGKKARSFTASYPGTRVTGEWTGKRWVLSMDGVPAMAAEGGRLGASTFVVQFAQITGSGYYDVNGAETPRTVTVGKGRALVFRDGRVYEARWSRPRGAKPTTYRIGGKRAVFDRGQIWVALLGNGQPVTIG